MLTVYINGLIFFLLFTFFVYSSVIHLAKIKGWKLADDSDSIGLLVCMCVAWPLALFCILFAVLVWMLCRFGHKFVGKLITYLHKNDKLPSWIK